MNYKEQASGADNTIMITAEFLEEGHILKNGRAELHRYELDLFVRDDITCDHLLGAIYAGLRNVLTDRFRLDVREDLSGVVYFDRQFPSEEGRSASGWRSGALRAKDRKEGRLRAAVLKRDIVEKMEDQLVRRYSNGRGSDLVEAAQERELLGWLVCWQVFLECYHAYYNEDADNGAASRSQRAAPNRTHTKPGIARVTVRLPKSPDRAAQEEDIFPMDWLKQKKDGAKTLRVLGFADGSRLVFDPVKWLRTASAPGELRRGLVTDDVLPELQSLMAHEQREIRIKPPAVPPQSAGVNPIPLVLSPLVTTGAAIGAWVMGGMNAQPEQVLLFSGAMVASSCAVSLINRTAQKKSKDAAMREWCKPYEQYIRHQLGVIQDRQQNDVELLEQAYPTAWDDSGRDLVSLIAQNSLRRYSRSPQNADFLCARMGRSVEGSTLVPSLFPITGDIDSHVYTGVRYRNLRGSKYAQFQLKLPGSGSDAPEPEEKGGDLEELPGAIAKAFGHLTHAPVLLDLKADTALGIVMSPSMRCEPFLAHLLLDLCFHHSPQCLQVVMLCGATNDWKRQQDQIRRYKHLPHFRGLLKERSAFAFCKQDAWEIFDSLLAVVRQRRQLGEKTPHILVILQEDYDIGAHALSSVLFRKDGTRRQSDGITLLLCKHSKAELPGFCGSWILADNYRQWYKMPNLLCAGETGYASYGNYGQYAFSPDVTPDEESAPEWGIDRLEWAFQMLGALHYRTADQVAVPAYLELLDIIGHRPGGKPIEDAAAAAGEDLDFSRLLSLRNRLEALVRHNWSRTGMTDLAVCLGRDAAGNVMLDLRDTADGAHLIVAGDHGSGKTEVAVSYLLALCTRFSPQQVKLRLVDIAGTGPLLHVAKLPHAEDVLLGPFDEIEALEDQLREKCRLMDREIAERKLRLKRTGSSDIWEHNQKLRNKMNNGGSDSGLQEMPHLFVVVEDCDDLAEILPGGVWDSMLDRMTEKMPGLGIHMILLTHRTKGLFTEVLLERIPARICMKLSDAETSERLICSAAAASSGMPGRGRAYIRRGGRSGVSCFQVGYSGVDIIGQRFAPFQVVMMPAGRNAIPFFTSEGYEIDDSDEELQVRTAYHPGTVSDNVLPQKEPIQNEPVSMPRSDVPRARHDEARQSDARPGEPGGVRQSDARPGEPGGVRQSDARPGQPGGVRQSDARPIQPGGVRQSDARPIQPGGVRQSDARPGESGGVRQSDARPGEPGGVRQSDARPGQPSGVRQSDARPGQSGSVRHSDVRPSRPVVVAGMKDNRQTEPLEPQKEARKPDLRELRGEHRTEQIKIPRPDHGLRSHKAIGISQAEFLVKVILECASDSGV